MSQCKGLEIGGLPPKYHAPGSEEPLFGVCVLVIRHLEGLDNSLFPHAGLKPVSENLTQYGERRYGRQSIRGVMMGRDPALLPECM